MHDKEIRLQQNQADLLLTSMTAFIEIALIKMLLAACIRVSCLGM